MQRVIIFIYVCICKQGRVAENKLYRYLDISKKVRDTSKVTIDEVAYELSIGTKIDDLG